MELSRGGTRSPSGVVAPWGAPSVGSSLLFPGWMETELFPESGRVQRGPGGEGPKPIVPKKRGHWDESPGVTMAEHHEPGGLKQHTLIPSQFWGPEAPSQGTAGLCVGEPLPCLSQPWWPQVTLACGCPTPVCSGSSFHGSSLCLCVTWPLLSTSEDTCCWSWSPPSSCPLTPAKALSPDEVTLRDAEGAAGLSLWDPNRPSSDNTRFKGRAPARSADPARTSDPCSMTKLPQDS